MKLDSRSNARLAVQETIIFWEKAQIPMREEHHCTEKLEKLIAEWKLLKKNKTRKSADTLNQVFNISHANVLILMKSKEDIEFFLNQLQPGRPGVIMG